MNHYNNQFMRGNGHSRPRLPQNISNSGHNYKPGYARRPMMGNVGPGPPMMHRFPRFAFSSEDHQDGGPRQSFGRGFHPYPRHEMWNPNGPGRRRFPTNPMQMQSPRNNVPFQNWGNERRRHMSNEENVNAGHHGQGQPQYVLRTTLGEQREREEVQRRVGSRQSHFTEFSASVNFTIRTSSYHQVPRRGGRMISKNLPERDDGDHTDYGDDTLEESGGGGAVAVEPINASFTSPSHSTDSDYEDNMAVIPGPLPDEYFAVIKQEPEGASSVPSSQEFEKYEPEHPDITTPNLTQNSSNSEDPEFSVLTIKTENCPCLMAPCDNEGFHEAFLGVCVSRYPSSALGRLIEVAGYGVWISDGHAKNFSGVLKDDRPQNVKAVMIHGSARAVDAMKEEGYPRIRINLETEYINENVLDWISKYMDNPTSPPSNWDEVKYHQEIIQLCQSATGTIIKWSHCSDASVKRTGITKAKELAKRATDAWIKDLRHREEAVGTTQ